MVRDHPVPRAPEDPGGLPVGGGPPLSGVALQMVPLSKFSLSRLTKPVTSESRPELTITWVPSSRSADSKSCSHAMSSALSRCFALVASDEPTGASWNSTLSVPGVSSLSAFASVRVPEIREDPPILVEMLAGEPMWRLLLREPHLWHGAPFRCSSPRVAPQSVHFIPGAFLEAVALPPQKVSRGLGLLGSSVGGGLAWLLGVAVRKSCSSDAPLHVYSCEGLSVVLASTFISGRTKGGKPTRIVAS